MKKKQTNPKTETLKNRPVSGTTHDYTKRGWGHDYVITEVMDGGLTIRMSGWGSNIQAGDYMLIVSQSTDPLANPDTRYQVKTVSYADDPRDMWSMEAVFAPRS